MDISETIQKAKFKGRLDFVKDNLIASNKFNQDMYQRRMEKETKYMKYLHFYIATDNNYYYEPLITGK